MENDKLKHRSYSASGIEGYFIGEKVFESGRSEKFKIVCPKCKAEGVDLKHKNWFESKELGTDLIIECKCGFEINMDNEEEREKCEVKL